MKKSMPPVIAVEKNICEKIGEKIVMYNNKKYYIINDGVTKYALTDFDDYFDYLEEAERELQIFIELKTKK